MHVKVKVVIDRIDFASKVIHVSLVRDPAPAPARVKASGFGLRCQGVK